MKDKKTGRDLYVVPNNLARHEIESRLASLSVGDQRVIAYLLAKGVPEDAEGWNGKIEGEVAELARLCDVPLSGDIYRAVDLAIDSLQKHVIRFIDPRDGGHVVCRWLAWGKYWRQEGRYTVEIPEPLRPVLVDLRKQRTEIDLETLLGLGGGAYAMRLYQLAKSWQSVGGWGGDIATLRKQLGVPEKAYSRISDFLRFAIDYPLKTINTKSDIRVAYAKSNKGRKWIRIQFTVKAQKAGLNRANARVIDPKNPQQITDLPEPEQLQAWAWIRTNLVAGADLPETMDWSLLKLSRTDALKHWIAEKNQIKMPFA
jgi:hypothetical protein